MSPTTPFSPRLLEAIAAEHGTPCYAYDAATMRARLARLSAFV